MPPQVALIICTIFVLWLLRLEHKQAPEVSFALWIPTIWMLSIASKPMGTWFGYGLEGVGAESGSPLDRVFLTGLLCLGLFILASRNFNWARAAKENTWLVLLIAYMLFSIFWSDIPYISFKRWTRELVAVVMAFIVLTEQDPHQALQSLFRRSAYILIPFSLLLINYFSAYGREYNRWTGELMWIGVTLQKNSLGRLCLIAAFFFVWVLIRRWQGSDIPVGRYRTYADVLVLIVTLWLLKGSPDGAYPATAFAALAAGLATFIGLLWMKRHRIHLGVNILTAIIALIIALGIVTPMVGGSTVAGFTSVLARDETLTGRTGIWATLLPIAMQRPILGHGLGGFWTPTFVEMYRINEAHSGYLDVLLGLGFVGILLVSLFLLSSCRKAQQELSRDYDWGVLWICYIIMAVVHNFGESSIDTFTSHLTAIILFFSVSSTNFFSRKALF